MHLPTLASLLFFFSFSVLIFSFFLPCHHMKNRRSEEVGVRRSVCLGEEFELRSQFRSAGQFAGKYCVRLDYHLKTFLPTRCRLVRLWQRTISSNGHSFTSFFLLPSLNLTLTLTTITRPSGALQKIR